MQECSMLLCQWTACATTLTFHMHTAEIGSTKKGGSERERVDQGVSEVILKLPKQGPMHPLQSLFASCSSPAAGLQVVHASRDGRCVGVAPPQVQAAVVDSSLATKV